jgi:hypothetical protein
VAVFSREVEDHDTVQIDTPPDVAVFSKEVEDHETLQMDTPAEVEGRPGQLAPGRARTSRPTYTWLDKLRHLKGFIDLEPQSNSDQEFPHG